MYANVHAVDMCHKPSVLILDTNAWPLCYFCTIINIYVAPKYRQVLGY